MTDAPAIYPALVAVQAGLGKVSKDGKGPSTQGSYPFMRVDTIVERLQPLFVEHGIAVIPRQEEATQELRSFPKVKMNGEPLFDGKPDAVQLITRLRYEFDFVSTEDGSKVTAAAYGESIDTGDKGIRRAATAAWKEVLLRLFVVVAGDEDPDAFDPNDQPAQVVHQNRGEQAMEKAAAGTGTEKPKRAPRTPRAQPKAVDEVSGAAESPAEERATPAEATDRTPAPEEASAPAAEPADDAPAAEATATRSPGRRPVPVAEDAAPAAAPEPEAPVETPPARVAEAPLTKPEPTTNDEKRYESVTDIRKAIRTALEAIGKDRDYANEIGDRITGKPRGQWFANLNDLHAVLREIESTSADDAEGGF